MFPVIYQYLSGTPAVTALVSTRIYGSGIAPQDAIRPYIIWQQISIDSIIYFDRPQDTDYDRVSIHAHSLDEAQAQAISRACRDALDPYGYLVGGLINDFDSDTNLYRCGFDWGFWDDISGITGGTMPFFPYAGDALTLVFGESLVAPLAVAVRAGAVFAADAAAPEEVAGILINSGSIGQVARVVVNGTVTTTSANWAAGQIFYNNGGGLTQTAPVSGWVQEVARSITSTVILVQVKTPVLQ